MALNNGGEIENSELEELFTHAMSVLTALPTDPNFATNCEIFQRQFASQPARFAQLNETCTALQTKFAEIPKIDCCDQNGFAIALILFFLIFAVPWKCGGRGGKRRKSKQNKKRRTVKRR